MTNNFYSYKGFRIEQVNGVFYAQRPLPPTNARGEVNLEKFAYIRKGGFSSALRTWTTYQGVERFLDRQ